MPHGLKIDDGPVAWDSPAIKLYESVADLIAGTPETNALALAKSKPVRFGVDIENTSGRALPGPCPCVTVGPFETPNRDTAVPANARYRAAVMNSGVPGEWVATVRDNMTSAMLSMAMIEGASPTVFYALNGSALAIRTVSMLTGMYKYWISTPSTGDLIEWDTPLMPQMGAIVVDGFSPDGLVFVAYFTSGTGASTVDVFDLRTMSQKTMHFTSIVNMGNAFALYFTPCSDWLARVPNQPQAELEVASLAAGAAFGTLVPLTNNGLNANVFVQGVGIQPLQVLTRGDQGIKITGPFDVQVNGMSVSSNTNPKIGYIDYRCNQVLPKVEVQVQPSATCNDNQSMPVASAFFDINATATPKRVRCLQPWTAPSNTVVGSPGAHFCAIAEAFTPTTINTISVPQWTGPSFAGLVVSEENIAQQNMLITRASQARAVFTARNPLPFAATSKLELTRIRDYSRRFSNWPRHHAEVTNSGLRRMGEDGLANALTLDMEPQSEQAVEIVATVPDGTPSPAAAAFEVVQTIGGVKVGGVVVVVVHGDTELAPARIALPVAGPPCPIELEGGVRLAYGSLDPAPGSATALYGGLAAQRVGAFFVTRKMLVDASVYAESTSHIGLGIEGLKIGVGDAAARQRFFASWEVDCASTPPGRHAVLVVCQAAGFEPSRLLLEFDVLEGRPWEKKRPWFEGRFPASVLQQA